MPENRADLAVVGAGILGLAHAYAAARRGLSVVVFERNLQASGASVRNFGMIWPIGQPAGRMHDMAVHSRNIWEDILIRSHLPFHPTGSLHVVYHPAERDVAQEFAAVAPGHGYECVWLPPEDVAERSGSVRTEGLLGGIWSPREITVDPRRTLAGLPLFLAEQYGVRFAFGAQVAALDLPRIETTTGDWRVTQAVVCGGDDFQTLFPEVFLDSGLTRVKLQMMRTAPQPERWSLGPALAAGLTLRFYASFRLCRSLDALRSYVKEQMPHYERWGIHVLVSETAAREVTLGDTHEYGRHVDIFDKPELDELVLAYARTFLNLPDWKIAQRWHGVYSLHPDLPYFAASPSPGVRIVTGVGGSGMTLSFGLAEESMKEMGL